MAEVPGICSDDAMLALTSLSFDIAGLELYLPLIKGARVICAPAEAATDPAYLSKVVSRFDVSMMQATPTTWRMFLQQDWIGFRNKLKVLCGGEALPGDLASALLARASEVWNMYGPTETTIWSTSHRVTTTELTSCIGRPIGNTKTYILDQHGEPVPAGVAGELYIGGEGLARGYLNRPDLTAERFLPDPFSGTSGGRMYKTGDLARYLENGNIDFLGRLDHQVKVRGFRIELGEIESALALHPQVKQCVVAARDDAAGDRRIIAYVVSRETHDSATSIKDVSEIGFSLFYFGAEEQQDENYRLYLECAKFADQNDFEAVWTPERHFHQVGRRYPNPAVLNAALATVTKRIRLRSGSVVLPLHDPIRVAEEWSVVDNLSGGRVGVSIASDGLPRDFVLVPEHYETRKEVMMRGIHSLQALWRGESLSFEDGAGKQSRISIYPKPLQSELPLWLASSGSPETFIQAGSIGTNVLTHLLGQTIDEVAANISLYREARAKNGYDPDEGKVTLMIHTLVGADFDDTLARAREPFLRYLRSHSGLLEAFAKSLNIPPEALHDQKADAILSFAFERYSKTASLIGTPQTCRQVVTRLHDAGVDELACLIDWIAPELALENLAHLKTLQELARKGTPTARSLRHHLKKHLPDYMLPNSFTFLDDLPRTPNGKLDRKALPAPEAAPRSAAAYAAPLGETEILIAKLWAEVLNTSRVGRHDDFFELGGHSLLAVHIVERMRAAGLEADVRMLFSSSTVAELALAAGKVKEITL
jgi:natural product biosynthesis luciferase-like monooxygenase protein